MDLAESYRDKLQERDAELVDLDADAKEWITNLAKAKEDRTRIAAVLSGSTPQRSGVQKAVRDGPVMVSLDMANKIQGTLQQIGAAFPPDLADAFVLAINACYTRPSCFPTAASEAPPTASPEAASATMPAVPPATVAAASPAALPVPEVFQPPTQTGEAPKPKGGKGMGAGKGERLAPYDAGSYAHTQNGCAQGAP